MFLSNWLTDYESLYCIVHSLSLTCTTWWSKSLVWSLLVVTKNFTHKRSGGFTKSWCSPEFLYIWTWPFRPSPLTSHYCCTRNALAAAEIMNHEWLTLAWPSHSWVKLMDLVPASVWHQLMANRFARMRKRSALLVFCVNVRPGKRLCQITVAAAVSRCEDPWGLFITEAESEKVARELHREQRSGENNALSCNICQGDRPLLCVNILGRTGSCIFPGQKYISGNIQYECWQGSLHKPQKPSKKQKCGWFWAQ